MMSLQVDRVCSDLRCGHVNLGRMVTTARAPQVTPPCKSYRSRKGPCVGFVTCKQPLEQPYFIEPDRHIVIFSDGYGGKNISHLIHS